MRRPAPVANRTLSRPIPRPPPAPEGGVVAVVLAAGSSARMGRPKPLVRLAGTPLLAHALQSLRGSTVRDIVVVLGSSAEEVRRDVPLEGTRVIVNERYSDGMSSSIRAGLEAAPDRAEAFLIVLGDQPLVSSATIDALVRRRRVEHARIVVPSFRGTRGNPVLFDRSLAPEIEDVRGDVGCRSVVADHASEVVEVPVEDPGILLDVDTPGDLEALERAMRDGTPLERLVRM